MKAAKPIEGPSPPRDPGLRGGRLAGWGLAIAGAMAGLILLFGAVLVALFVKGADIRQRFLVQQAHEVIDSSSLGEREGREAVRMLEVFISAAGRGEVDREAFEDVEDLFRRCWLISSLPAALERSGFSVRSHPGLFEKVRKLNSAVSRGLLSEEDVEHLVASLPGERGVMRPPPWSKAEVLSVETALDRVLSEKQVETEAERPDFAREIRKAVLTMRMALEERKREGGNGRGPA